MSATEKLKLWAASIIVIMVVWLGGYAEVSPGVRLGGVIAGLVFAGGLVVFSQSGRDFYHFIQEAGVELRKVVWPGKQETTQLTGIVFVFLMIATLFLWLVDLVIGYILGFLIG